ncbi:hypothetical protein ACFQ60_19410 [Streptomyces zhihengii]
MTGFVLLRVRAHRLLLAAALLAVVLTTCVLSALAAFSGSVGDAALRHTLGTREAAAPPSPSAPGPRANTARPPTRPSPAVPRPPSTACPSPSASWSARAPTRCRGPCRAPRRARANPISRTSPPWTRRGSTSWPGGCRAPRARTGPSRSPCRRRPRSCWT